MAIVNSSTEGLNCLRSMLEGQMEQLTQPLGYIPTIAWKISEQIDNPANDKAWLLMMNVIDSDSQTAFGRPRRYTVLGTYNVFIHYPQQGTAYLPVDEVSENIKTAFYEQRVLRPYNILSATINDVDPIEQWNRKQIAISYRFQYFV